MKKYNSSKALQDFFKVVSLSVDKGDVTYISTLEGRKVSRPSIILSTVCPTCRVTEGGCSSVVFQQFKALTRPWQLSSALT